MTEEVVIEPGTAKAFRLPQGTMLGIRDVEGAQSCELIAFDADDTGEYLDGVVTMEILGRVFPTEKSKFYSNRYEPLLTLVEDAVVHHDMMQPSSSKFSRALYYGESGERSGTREWHEAALAEHGIAADRVPHPVHLFRRTDVDAEGNFALMNTPSKAGEGVVVHCERTLIVSIAVPDDEISPITGCNPTPIRVEIGGGAAV